MDTAPPPQLLSPAPPPAPRAWPPIPLRHIVLFVATLFTTTLSGAMLEMEGTGAGTAGSTLLGIIGEPTRLLAGLPFSLSLLTILGCHEMGHFIACRRYRVDASWPYFLPMVPYPFSLIGTLGAFIRIRTPIPTRNALFDIGAAGPIAGFVVTLPVLWIGLIRSEVVVQPDAGGIALGAPLLLRGLAAALFAGAPADGTISLHPMALAGWIGLLATSLNLLPVGQLDGGHVCYSVSRRFHAFASRLTLFLFVALAMLWHSYLVWAIILLILGRRHPPVGIEALPLSRGRVVLAWICLLIFLLCFVPDPIRILD